MKALRKALVAAASFAGLMVALGTAPAMAAGITFTWDPSATGVGPAQLSTNGAFTSNNFFTSDYSHIVLGPNTGTANDPIFATVVENSILAINSFAGVSPTGFVGTNLGPAAPANSYRLYFVVAATSHISDVLPGPTVGLLGAFDTVTYTLFGDKGGNCDFGVNAGGTTITGCGADTQIALASGSLSGPFNSATIFGGVPGAEVSTDINVAGTAGGFFVSPANFSSLLFDSAFTNNSLVVSFANGGNTILVDGGGGNTSLLAIPEPVTLSLFGAGLVGMAGLRRRKSKKA